MSTASSPRLLLLAGLTGFLLLGCKQDAGERCEINSDCKGGLTCVMTGTAGGVCSSGDAPSGTGGGAGTAGTGGSAVPDAGGTGGGGGSAGPDVNRDVADTAPTDSVPEASPTDAVDAVDAIDARDGQAG